MKSFWYQVERTEEGAVEGLPLFTLAQAILIRKALPRARHASLMVICGIRKNCESLSERTSMLGAKPVVL